jgi:hypothetical protein
MKPIKLISLKDLKRNADLRKRVDNAFSEDAKAAARAALTEFVEATWNIKALEPVFAEVNGRAARHTYDAQVVPGLVRAAEKRLETAGVTVANRPGTRVTCLSGVPESKAYARRASSAVATKIVLTRTTTAWVLTSVERVERYAGPGGHERITTEVSSAAKADIERLAFSEFALLPTPTPIEVVA